MMDFPHELTAQERAGRIVWLFSEGAELTVRQVCDLTGLRKRAAQTMLNQLSRVVPIVREGDVWRVCARTSILDGEDTGRSTWRRP